MNAYKAGQVVWLFEDLEIMKLVLDLLLVVIVTSVVLGFWMFIS